MSKKETLKQQILDLTREYYKEVHGSSRSFEPSKSLSTTAAVILMTANW